MNCQCIVNASILQVSFPVSDDVEVATGKDSSILVEIRPDQKREEVSEEGLVAAKKRKVQQQDEVSLKTSSNDYDLWTVNPSILGLLYRATILP